MLEGNRIFISLMKWEMLEGQRQGRLDPRSKPSSLILHPTGPEWAGPVSHVSLHMIPPPGCILSFLAILLHTSHLSSRVTFFGEALPGFSWELPERNLYSGLQAGTCYVILSTYLHAPLLGDFQGKDFVFSPWNLQQLIPYKAQWGHPINI